MENVGSFRLNLKRGIWQHLSLVRFMRISWFGRGGRNGCYSVKSGYKLAMQYIIRSDKYHVEEEVEDDVHTFFTCASALSSWQAVGLSSVMVFAACQQGSATDRVFALCRNEDYETIGRVASLFWSIWHNRNDKIWNDNVRTPSQVGRAAFDHWSEWFAVHKMRSPDDHYAPPLSTD
ncbi:hypothetical protein L195_g034440, partial [Trifolium pratense]